MTGKPKIEIPVEMRDTVAALVRLNHLNNDKPDLRVGRGHDQFPLRLPDGTRDEIKWAARTNGRSKNAEILHRLAAYDASNPNPVAKPVVAVDVSQVETAIEAVGRLRRAVTEASAACHALGIKIEVLT